MAHFVVTFYVRDATSHALAGPFAASMPAGSAWRAKQQVRRDGMEGGVRITLAHAQKVDPFAAPGADKIFEHLPIEPGSVFCTFCGSDLVDGPGCQICGERGEPGDE